MAAVAPDDYSLDLIQLPKCTHYIAVSWCWDQTKSGPSQNRKLDPKRPQIPLDLEALHEEPPPGWNFYTEIPNVQQYAIPNEDTQKWANNLKFLGPHHSSRAPTSTRCPSCAGSQAHSIPAFSDELRDLVLPNEGAAAPIRVQSGNGDSRNNKAPRAILDRAVRFAATHGIGLIWMDKECIDQDDRVDKELAIQSMDLVYQRSRYPLGIVSDVCIHNQDQLHALAKLMANKDMTNSEWCSAATALKTITHSKFFTRAWICQELQASGCMLLLIPCDPILDKDSEVLGATRGEIEIRLDSSLYGLRSWRRLRRELITRTESKTQDLDWPLHDMCHAWDTLRIHLTGNDTFTGTEDVSNNWGVNKNPDFRAARDILGALELMENKKNSISSERLTILANICNFRTKLDTSGIADFTLSTCVIALALINYHWTWFTPINCEAIQQVVQQVDVPDYMEVSSVKRAEVVRRAEHDNNDIHVHVIHPLNSTSAIDTSQSFLTINHQRVICKGRLWVTDDPMVVRGTRDVIQQHQESETSSSELLDLRLFWLLIVSCVAKKYMRLALHVWKNVQASEAGKNAEVTEDYLSTLVAEQRYAAPLHLLQSQFALPDSWRWLRDRIEEEALVFIAKCVGTDLQFMPSVFGITSARMRGSTILERQSASPSRVYRDPYLEGYTGFWKVRRAVWEWRPRRRMKLDRDLIYDIVLDDWAANDGTNYGADNLDSKCLIVRSFAGIDDHGNPWVE